MWNEVHQCLVNERLVLCMSSIDKKRQEIMQNWVICMVDRA